MFALVLSSTAGSSGQVAAVPRCPRPGPGEGAAEKKEKSGAAQQDGVGEYGGETHDSHVRFLVVSFHGFHLS